MQLGQDPWSEKTLGSPGSCACLGLMTLLAHLLGFASLSAGSTNQT